MQQHAGIILCGGRSIRMGSAKWALKFGDETMLARTLRLLGQVCSPLVVVAAADQELTGLGEDFLMARDRRPDQGPLEGLLAGLSALPRTVEAAYVTSCDAPFLAPSFVRRLFELLGDHAISVPTVDGFTHPLSAVYRTSLVDVIETLLAQGRRRPRDLFHVVATRKVGESELVDVDPQLATLRNVNTPEEYRAALVEAGFQPPADGPKVDPSRD
jgi:molybdenum cofactor guanylyltransferase